MTGTVKIGNHEVELAANAATPLYYTQIFHEDFFTSLMKGSGDTEKLDFNIFPKIAYIMKCQAEKMDMTKLNDSTFLSWLSEFEATDFAEAGDQIINIYNGNKRTHAIPKK